MDLSRRGCSRNGCRRVGRGRGQQDRVNDVVNAIALRHVGASDVGIVHSDRIRVGYGQLDGGAVEGLDGAGYDIQAWEFSAEVVLLRGLSRWGATGPSR